MVKSLYTKKKTSFHYQPDGISYKFWIYVTFCVMEIQTTMMLWCFIWQFKFNCNECHINPKGALAISYPISVLVMSFQAFRCFQFKSCRWFFFAGSAWKKIDVIKTFNPWLRFNNLTETFSDWSVPLWKYLARLVERFQSFFVWMIVAF